MRGGGGEGRGAGDERQETKSKERGVERRQEEGEKGRVRKLANVIPPTGRRAGGVS